MKSPKAQKCEKCGNMLWKGRLFLVWELKQEGLVLCNVSRECVYPATHAFCHSAHVLEGVCAASIDFLVTNEFWRAGRFANAESVNNEDWPFLVPINLSLTIFGISWAQIVPDLATGNPSRCLSCLSDMSPSFFDCLLSCSMRFSRLILYFLCPSSEVRHFSKELWFHLMENDT